MKKIVLILVLVVIGWAMVAQAENMVINKEKNAQISQGKVEYTSGTLTLNLINKETGQKVKVENVRFVDLKINEQGLSVRSTYLYYKLNNKDVVDATNAYQALNLPIPFTGNAMTSKMRGMNLQLARQMLRNAKYELLNLCLIYQGYKAVGEKDSKEAQDVAQRIQQQIKTIQEKYGEEALDANSVLTYAGLK